MREARLPESAADARLGAETGSAPARAWEPAWVASSCKTRWGTGSGWDNATFFDQRSHEALPAFQWLKRDYLAGSKSSERGQ